MKKLLSFAAIMIFCIPAISAQQTKQKIDPAGQWKFEAPYAPEGFTAGTIDVGFADNKYTVNMLFTTSGYSFTGEKTAVRNDSLFFNIFVEGTDVSVALKMEDTTKMTGNAVHYEGTVPLTLTKEEVQK